MGLMSKIKLKKSKPEDELLDDDAVGEGDGDDVMGEDAAPKKKAKKQKEEKVQSAGGGPKQFLVDHGEKVVLGVIGLSLLLMIWSAFGRERLPENRAPGDLQQQASRVETEIASSAVPVVSASASRFEPRTREKLEPIDGSFLLSGSFSPANPLYGRQKATKRGDPKIFPAENLLAIAGVGHFIAVREKDILGIGNAERERLRLEREKDEAKLAEEEEARKLREKRAKEKKERDAKRKKKTTSRDRRRDDDDQGARSARIAEREEQAERPLPDQILARGFTSSAESKDTELVASGRFWVSIVGKAPRLKQQQEFNDKFRDAMGYNPQRDQPVPLGISLQRIEVSESDGDAALDWSKARTWNFKEQTEAIKAEKEAWAGEAQPVIADSYFHPKLTQPLGPLAMQSWEPWAAHPDVMLKGEISQGMEDPLDEEEENLDEEEKEDSGDPFGLEGTSTDRETADPRGRGPRDTGRRPNIAGGLGDEYGVAESRGRLGVSVTEQAKFYQIRIFDFDVEPGKRYRYRVQMALRNPNSSTYGEEAVPPAFLSNPQSRDTAWKATEWSEPTNMVVIPTGQQAFAGLVNLPEEDDEFDEPYATILTKVINFGKGTTTTALFDVYRGGMVSGITKGFVIDPIKRTVTRQNDSLVESDLLLLDMRGGPKNLNEKPEEAAALGRPAEMLLLDSKGNLVVRSAVDDGDEMIDYKLIAGESVSVGGDRSEGGVPVPFPGGEGFPGEPGGDEFDFFNQGERRR